jgi:hypothetical protein
VAVLVRVPEGFAGPGVEKEPPGQAHEVARFPQGHPVRRGDRVELAVDVSQLSLFDPHTGQALWNPDFELTRPGRPASAWGRGDGG